MKKQLFLLILICCFSSVAAAQTVFFSVDQVISFYIEVNGGPANTTISYNLTQSNSGIVGYSLSAEPYTETLNLPVTLNGSGYGVSYFNVKGLMIGQTTYSACSPQIGCTNNLDFRVVTVVAVNIQAIDSPLDNNPNAAGGRRIFPDKTMPVDPPDRRKIRIQAQFGGPVAGVRIYFSNFDLDDPSANTAPIDSEPTPNAGDDNNGNVDGTPNTKAGLLSIPQGASGCALFSAGISCTTDANGVATVEFTTTMQPGDNFTIAASTSDTYLINLSLTADGINLKDTNGIQIPVTTTTSNACSSTTVRACRSEMLTVWRKLHIEVDSMGVVSNNFVEGMFPANKRVGQGTKTLSVLVDPDLEVNRFENGRITIGVRSYPVIDATPTINANTANTVTIFNNQGTFEILAGDHFTLVDDDDFNDSAQIDADDGADLPQPETSLLLSSDVPCTSALTDNCNVLAPAYIKPYYDLTNVDTETDYVANLSMTTDIINNPPIPADVRVAFDFDNESNEASANFWTIYVSTGYQIDNRWDRDPDNTIGVGGIVDASLGAGQGALLFLENSRTGETGSYWGTSPITRRHTVAHEIGHLFNGQHNDVDPANGIVNAGLMAPSVTGTVYRTDGTFNAVTILKMRGGSWGGVRITHP